MTEPRYFDDFVRVWRDDGETTFRKHYTRHVLIGVGVVGELDESGRRGEASTFLAALHDQPVKGASLQKRIWLLKRSPYGPGTRHVWIGRGAGNDVVIPEHSISKAHCRMHHDNGRILLTDLDSHNGTFVEGARIPAREPWPLHDEDELILGRYKFQLLTARTFLTRVHTAASSVYYL